MERKVQIAEIEEDEDDDGHCMETSDLLFRYKTSSLFSVDDGGTKTVLQIRHGSRWRCHRPGLAP